MSNYTQTTFFGPKDSLPAGNPAKTIFGAPYDVEFGNIATAIASKPDATTPGSFLNVNVTGSTIPTNGIYLPTANTLGFATAGVLAGSINATGTWVLGPPPGTAAPTLNNALRVTGYPGSYAVSILGGATAGTSLGMIIQAGTNSSDFSLSVINEAGSQALFFIRGDGSGSLGYSTAPGVISWTAAGNVTIGPPSSGNALTIGGPFGYGPAGLGIGGTVTQTPNRAAQVTLNKICGQVTLASQAGTPVASTIIVNNSLIAATDTVVISLTGTANVYLASVMAVLGGAFEVSYQTTGGVTVDTAVLNFAIIKAVAS